MAGCPVRGKEAASGEFPMAGTPRQKCLALKYKSLSLWCVFSVYHNILLKVFYFTQTSVKWLWESEWFVREKKQGLSFRVYRWCTVKKKATLGTSQSPGEESQNQGKLVAGQMNSGMDMSQRLNILMKGNFQGWNSSSLLSKYMVLDNLYNL